MDFLRQIPIGQFAAPELEEQAGGGSWLRRLDPRLKLAWTLAFLVTPILAGPIWRLALVGLLLLITALSGLSCWGHRGVPRSPARWDRCGPRSRSPAPWR